MKWKRLNTEVNTVLNRLNLVPFGTLPFFHNNEKEKGSVPNILCAGGIVHRTAGGGRGQAIIGRE